MYSTVNPQLTLPLVLSGKVFILQTGYGLHCLIYCKTLINIVKCVIKIEGKDWTEKRDFTVPGMLVSLF